MWRSPVACLHGVQEVAGSNPVIPTKKRSPRRNSGAFCILAAMTIFAEVFSKSKHILIYGAAMAVLVFLLKWLQWEYLISDYSIDIYISLIAVFFTILGIWIAVQIVKSKTKTVVVEKGEMKVGNVMKVTMSCDHRAVDGAVGAKFLQTFKQLLENPVLMLV